MFYQPIFILALWFICLGMEGFSYSHNLLAKYVTKMIVGSFIAGATSLGGAAVGFPVIH
jgi:hypothetical protein